MCSCCIYHELVDIGEKKSCFFVRHAYGLPTAPIPCADLTQLCMLDLDAGKGRQVMKCIQLQILQCWLYYATMAEERAGYVL